MALLRLLFALLIIVLGSASALAHASLIKSDPVDGAVLVEAPSRLVLTFNEPVSPLVMRLIADDGTATILDRYHLEDDAVVIDAPRDLGRGTHALSWRVISADGHPVGGSLLFSVGAQSAGALPGTAQVIDWPVTISIWLARILIYLGLFVGVGGLFFHAFLARAPIGAQRTQRLVVIVALLALPVSIGLQGLDALDVPLSDLGTSIVWSTGFGTSYGTAALIAGFGLLIALLGLWSERQSLLRLLSIVSLAALGLALASTGHASAAVPQWLTRPAVFIHAAAIAIWTGALLPLGLMLREGDVAASSALVRFSRTILYAVGPLVLTGLILAVLQIEHVDALWTTAYGRVFLGKLVALFFLFGLAALNRWRFTAPAEAGEKKAIRQLARSVGVEIILVVAIFAIVAMWRFTPPPRAIEAAAALPASVHIHTGKAMADLSITPGHAGPVTASIVIMTGDFGPLDAREVTLVLSNPAAGIEPIKRPATKPGDGTWRIDDLTIPVPGRWTVQLAILVSDFDLVRLESTLDVRP